MSEQGNVINPEKEDLRIEYQAAQDSAQHHDNLIWTTTGIIWGADLVLLGFVLANLTISRLKIVITAASILGILMCIFVWSIALYFNNVMNQKYKRCKEIESLLGLKQHTTLKRWMFKGFQRIFYAIIVCVFVVSWVLIIITTWSL